MEYEKAVPGVLEMPRVLIAEDEPDMATLLVSLVEAALPHAVIETVADGGLALDRVSLLRPHLLLSDLILPGCDGYSLCDAVRSMPSLAHTRIIMLTAYGSPGVRGYFRSIGVRCLDKPFEPEEIRQCIRDVMSKPAPRAPGA